MRYTTAFLKEHLALCNKSDPSEGDCYRLSKSSSRLKIVDLIEAILESRDETSEALAELRSLTLEHNDMIIKKVRPDYRRL